VFKNADDAEKALMSAKIAWAIDNG